MRSLNRLLPFALAACHHASTAPVVQDSLGNETAQQDQVFRDAATLLARGPAADTPRVTIGRYGEARMQFDGPTEISADPQEADEIAPVSEVRGTRVRLLHDTVSALVLLWVDRAALETVVVHEARVVGTGDVGVWLRAGTELASIAPAQDEPRRAIVVDFDGLGVTGEIDAAALGDLWIPPPDEVATLSSIGEDLAIRATPDDAGGVVATTTWSQMVTVVARADGWALVETTGPHVIARGYVREVALGGALGGLRGHRAVTPGNARGDTITIPAGACLYDGKAGPLAGAQVTPSIENHVALGDGWHQIEVNTFYGLFELDVHETDGTFDLCAEEKPP